MELHVATDDGQGLRRYLPGQYAGRVLCTASAMLHELLVAPWHQGQELCSRRGGSYNKQQPKPQPPKLRDSTRYQTSLDTRCVAEPSAGLTQMQSLVRFGP